MPRPATRDRPRGRSSTEDASFCGRGDQACRHHAPAVEPWGTRHPPCAWRWCPPDWPRATLLERLYGYGHDQCSRPHQRQRVCDACTIVRMDCLSMGSPLPTQLRPLSYRLRPCTASSALWRGRLASRCQAYLYRCRGCLATYVINVITQRTCSMERADRHGAVRPKKSALKPSLSRKEGLSAPG